MLWPLSCDCTAKRHFAQPYLITLHDGHYVMFNFEIKITLRTFTARHHHSHTHTEMTNCNRTQRSVLIDPILPTQVSEQVQTPKQNLRLAKFMILIKPQKPKLMPFWYCFRSAILTTLFAILTTLFFSLWRAPTAPDRETQADEAQTTSPLPSLKRWSGLRSVAFGFDLKNE